MHRVTSAEQVQVFEEIGRGAFGVVYRGVIRSTNLEVAVKQIDLEHEAADFHEVYKEIQILSECQSPHITKYLGCFVKHHKLWVIMEFVDGGTVYEMLRAGAIADENTVATLTYDIVLALEYLHAQRKIHRDLKSANVLVSRSGAVKLTDFGVSTQLQSHFSRRNTTVGTPYWMAPEVIKNSQGHGFEADVWSLGCCVYEMLTGAPPLQSQYAPMAALRRISALGSAAEFMGLLGPTSFSASATDFLRRCFAVSPSSRPSPSALLSHPFLQLRLEGDARRRCLSELASKKSNWDRDNRSSQQIYTPTEKAEKTTATLRFDLSTIVQPAPDDSAPVASPYNSAPVESPYKTAKTAPTLETTAPGLILPARAEFRRILTKVSAKMERKWSLSADQRRNLAVVSEGLSELFCVPAGDAGRILACQYLRYMIKEIRGSDIRAMVQEPSMSELRKSMMEDRKPAMEDRKSAMDDIERSLLESWLASMQDGAQV